MSLRSRATPTSKANASSSSSSNKKSLKSSTPSHPSSHYYADTTSESEYAASPEPEIEDESDTNIDDIHTTATSSTTTNGINNSNSNSSKSSANNKVALTGSEKDAKIRAAWTRIWTSAVMFFGVFIPILYIGHPALLCLLFACQVMMYKEIKRLTSVLSRKSALPSFRPLQWYWFFIAIYFVYGKLLDHYFQYTIPYHSFISFILYICGVITFVLTLRKGK